MRRLALAAALLVLALPAGASGETLLPPKKKVYTGVTGSKSVAQFAGQVGKHPASSRAGTGRPSTSTTRSRARDRGSCSTSPRRTATARRRR